MWISFPSVKYAHLEYHTGTGYHLCPVYNWNTLDTIHSDSTPGKVGHASHCSALDYQWFPWHLKPGWSLALSRPPLSPVEMSCVSAFKYQAWHREGLSVSWLRPVPTGLVRVLIQTARSASCVFEIPPPKLLSLCGLTLCAYLWVFIYLLHSQQALEGRSDLWLLAQNGKGLLPKLCSLHAPVLEVLCVVT